MSTRAVITFSDKDDTFHVYKHYDGYPKGVLPHISEAREYSWLSADYKFGDPTRFEASDFAAAFVRATKKHGGDVRLTTHWNHHGDLAYRYEVTFQEGLLHVTCFLATPGKKNGRWKRVYAGTPAEIWELLLRFGNLQENVPVSA